MELRNAFDMKLDSGQVKKCSTSREMEKGKCDKSHKIEMRTSYNAEEGFWDCDRCNKYDI